nr:formin-like protein 18 [Lolium perenne]
MAPLRSLPSPRARPSPAPLPHPSSHAGVPLPTMTASDAPSGSGSDSGSSTRSYRDVASSASPHPRHAPSGPFAPPAGGPAARVLAQARLGPRSEVHRVRGGRPGRRRRFPAPSATPAAPAVNPRPLLRLAHAGPPLRKKEASAFAACRPTTTSVNALAMFAADSTSSPATSRVTAS